MIGLFFGDNDFPKKILKKIKELNKAYFIIDLSKNKNFKKDNNSYQISIGQFGKIIRLIKEKKCKNVLFAGKINKPIFSKLKLDLKGLYYIPKIIRASKLGDAAILNTIIKVLAKEKIKVVSSIKYNPELTLAKGNYTKLKPNKNDHTFIDKGIKSLLSLNAYNHVQGLVIRNSKIIATETFKGTKKMLHSIKKSNKFYSILIKFPKKKQDLRIDLPTIGLDTLKDCKKVGVVGVILKSKQNIFMDKDKCINYANKNKMFITIK
ncbi:UDP-2,3-diacylglucosamine diphosphatase LpxI [Candidatus Pelagibacter sp. Uisw_092]|uniref:UDP-2,3-diacylglucosamine diphosphatase LpxI domain-containing protein n=1 Tax=Candidatus Pelagibacter sp. Uisw_092 TaxID=3230979 RepID=UPI0039E8E493